MTKRLTHKFSFLLLSILFVVGFSTSAQAQIVTIPDANFVAFLQANYPSCITGDQLDTQCPEVLTETSVDVSYDNISDLTGIEYFVSLTTLDCSDNSLSSLPALPAGLTSLICFANDLTSLPTLPAGLLDLNCSHNQLASLPALPNGLVTLQVSANMLTSLPTLPAGLTGLECGVNNLGTLPALPSGLTYLWCTQSQLTSLPTLPAGLEQLICPYNQLTLLPALPNSLSYINCSSNQLTFLPPLPEAIVSLDCAENLLQALPAIPEGIESLNCSFNPDLACLPILPQSLVYFGNLFSEISVPGTSITCIPNLPPFLSSLLPICTSGDLVNNPNGCINDVSISGLVYTDLSGNCSYENTESAGQGIKLLLIDDLNDTVGVAYTNSSGNYTFHMIDSGNYTLVVDTLNKPYEVQCVYPGVDTSFAVVADSTMDVQFALNCPSGDDYGAASVFTQGIIFPGQQHLLRVFAGDLVNLNLSGCAPGTASSGTVEITVTGNVNYLGSGSYALIPSSSSGNIFTYVIPDFAAISTDSAFSLIFETATTASIDEEICVNVVVNSGTTDLNPSNDSLFFCYPIVNSYDPNIKEVYPTTVEPGYDDWLTYTIHFQNTGNAPAFNIKLKDTLSTLVQPNSFELLANSHNVGVELNGYNATFRFDNIMLPDSASDPEGSIGYIQYRVKPLSNLPEGTEIDNKCYIFFDYNSPIITNTATTSFEVDNSGLTENESSQLTVYPNPTTGVFSFDLPNEVSENGASILIYNIAGEKVSEYLLNASALVTLDLSAEKAGIYFMILQSGDRVTTCKLIKQ